LLELLLVIAIIAILAGMVVGIARYVWFRTRSSVVKAEIKTIESSLRTYKNDYGDYPQCANSNMPMTIASATANSKKLLAALAGSDGTTLLPQSGKKAYFTAFRDTKQGNVAKDGSEYYLRDAWDRPYQYVFSGFTNRVTFDLGSAGPDGVFNTADDIWNYQF
jgi:type II secretory pathway pseudopilin PulG